jgi:hypothetical protein
MFFTNQRPNRMVFFGKPEGILWPPADVPEGEDTVPGFQWQGMLKKLALEQIAQSSLLNPNRGGYALFLAQNGPGAVERNDARTSKRKNRRR